MGKYYMGEDGKFYKEQQQPMPDGKYYMGEDGKFYREQQQSLPDGKYEMNADGTFSLQKVPAVQPETTASLGATPGQGGVSVSSDTDPLSSVRSMMAQIESDYTRNAYTAGAGTAGMTKFTADKQAAMKKEGEKTFWQRVLEATNQAFLAANDNPAVMSFNQVKQQYEKDTSYREPNDDWTDRQKDIFGYLYERDPAGAYSFAQQINDAINTGKRQNAQKQAAQNATESVGSGVGHAALGRVTNLMGAADLLDKAAEFAARGTVTQKGVLSPYEYGKAADTGITEHLNETGGTIAEGVPVFGGTGWGEVYSLATSVADSMIGRYVGGKWGTAVNTFSGIMSSTMNRDMEKGASKGQAALHGLVSGLAEAGVEFMDVDRLIKLKSADGLKGFLRNVVKTAAPEGIEETITAVIDTAADQMILGDKSDFNALVEEYRAAGYAEKDAKTQAWIDTAEDILYAAFAGAAAGGISGGIETGIKTGKQAYYDTKTGKQYAGAEQELIEEGFVGGEGTESYTMAEKLQEQIKAGKGISARQIGQMVRTNEQQIYEEDARKLREAAEKRLMQLGESGGTYEVAEVIVKQLQGQELTGKERRLLQNSRYGQRVANEMDADNIRSGGYDSGWAEKIGTERINDREYNRGVGQEIDVAPIEYEESNVAEGNSGRDGRPVPYKGNDDLSVSKADSSLYTRESGEAANTEQQEERVLTFQEEVARQLGIEQTEQQPEEKLSYAEMIRRAENNNNGGNTNATAQSQYTAAQPGTGNGISDGSSQRAAGMGAGEPAGGLAGSAGRTAQRTAATNVGKAAADRQNRARHLRQQGLIQPVSSKSLGLNKGTDAQNLLVLPVEQYDEELRSVAERIKAETGKDVTFVVGEIQIRTQKGMKNVRGVRTPGSIIVQCNNLKATATQIADHEAYHDKVAASWGLGWSVKQYVTANYSEEEFRAVVDKYAAAMEGIVDIRDGDDYEEFLRRVEEEVLADAYAGIDYRGFGATKLTEPVNEFMDQKGVGKLRQQDNGVRQTNAPPTGQNENTVEDDGEWYSFADIEDITPSQSAMNRNVRSVANMEPVYTVGEESLSDSGKDIKEIYREAFASWGNNLYTKQFGDIAMMESSVKSEFAHGSTAQKIAAVEAIPSVIENGKIIDWFEKHSGLFRITVAAPIEIGEAPYIMGVMLQRDNQNQRLYLHDVIIEKEVSDLLEEHLSTTGPAKKDKNLFMTNILERVTDVKRKDATYLDAVNRGDMKTAQRMVDEAAKAAGYTIKAYHGTDVDSFNVFDKGTIGKSSGVSILGDGFYFADKKNVAQQYGRYVYEVYLKQTTPYTATNDDSYKLNAAKLEADGYDSVVMTTGKGKVYMVLDSEQIKSAEPVTYDDDGNVIPLSQRFNEESNDIRYSMDDSDYDRLDAELKSESQRWRTTWLKDQLGEEGYQKYRENRAQREAEQRKEQRQKDREKRKVDSNRRKLQKEYRDSVADAAMNKKLREGAKPTEAKKELRTSVLDMFSIPAGSRAEAVQIIDGYADRIIKNGVLTDADRKAFFDRMYAAGVMTVPADQYMALGRDAIYKGKIYVGESLRRELGDDWAELRRRAFGAGVYLTNDRSEAGVDVWNNDLASVLPGLFDPEETDQRQILERIVQVAEEGRDEKVSLAEYTAQLAGEEYVSEDEILDGMERDLDTALRIFAKTAGIEIKVKEQAIRSQAALTKENYRQRLQATQERQERKEQARLQTEQKQLREMQQKTLKTLQWLSKNRNRAPEELQAAFDEVLSDLDIYAVGAANEMRWSDKYNATWKDIVDMYDHDRQENPNFLPNPELERLCDRLRKRKLEDMDVEMLQDLYQAATALRTEIQNRRNVINDTQHRLFEEVFADTEKELSAARGRKMGGANDLFNKDQLSAMNVIERMGGVESR